MSWATEGRIRRSLLGAVCALVLTLGAAPAKGAAPHPEFFFFPGAKNGFQGPCGLTVDRNTKADLTAPLYVSDYYRHAVDVYSFDDPQDPLQTQITNVDPLDGPCGLDLDQAGSLYVNNFHRNVEKFLPSIYPVKKGGPSTPPTTYSSAGAFDSAHPTGVAVDPATGRVYVNNRTYVSAYDSSGAPLMDGSEPLRIGLGSLGDGYGLAFSSFPATAGLLYVPDAADRTVKVYDPASLDPSIPVDTIDATDSPGGSFVSLHDSAVAIDNVSGEVYVADTLGPQLTERPQATIHVFDHTGAYEGRLLHNVVDAGPPGLAVDNSKDDKGGVGKAQGRVYVTSGNDEGAGVYAYPSGSATFLAQPALFSLAVSSAGSGGGLVSSEAAGIECAASCEEQVPAGAAIPLTATPDPGSAFLGWSGGGCSGPGVCTVRMSEAASVRAEFAALAGPPAGAETSSPAPLATASEIVQRGKLRVTASGDVAPRRLPRTGVAPIAVSVGGKIAMTDASPPPQLRTLRIELNRYGRLDSAGLPTCRYSAIQPASSSRALTACRDALVGKGSFTANISLADQEPFPTTGRLLVFNSVRGGKPVLFGHIYSGKPFATSFVIVFTLQKLRGGTFGTALNAQLPRALGSWGNLTGLEMTLSRQYTYRGSRHSFLSAGCPAPKGFPGAIFPLARTSFAFEGGAKLTSTLTSTCKVKG